MREDLTVIYYTSNREKPEFEERIRGALAETIGGVPLISVSQKPIDFGDNICVGDIGVSVYNAFKQFQIGALEAKTKYVCAAEADCLYPKEYFEFTPKKHDRIYTPHPVYVLFAYRGISKVFARRTRYSDFGIVSERTHIINRIEKQLRGMELAHIGRIGIQEEFEIGVPVVSFKTGNSLHRKVPHVRDSKVRELPHWGSSYDLIRKFME